MTHEIARSDEGREPDWRISLATIDRDGPFSDFTGYDRTIVPIGGEGFELIFENGERRTLDPVSMIPFSFAGERKLECRLLAGVSQDVNVLTRRSNWQHEVRVSGLWMQPTFLEMTPRSFLVAAGDMTVIAESEAIDVRGGSTVAFDDRVNVSVRTDAAQARALVIRVLPRA